MTIERSKNRVEHWPESDWRWPKLCAYCGLPFHEDDPAKLLHETLYRWTGTTILLTISEAPPGAMWDAVWHRHQFSPGPDGRRLQVRLPDGVDWNVDREAGDNETSHRQDGKIWTREGSVTALPPTVTVTPSVITRNGNGWNGNLTNGYLVEKVPVEDDMDDLLFEEDDDFDEYEDDD